MENQILLDEHEYDYLFFGTSLVDSLIAACLAKSKKKILILDIDNSYSSSLQTLNLKEFLSFLSPKIQKDQGDCLKKNTIFSNFWYDSSIFSLEEFQKNMNLFEYKNYNIDLQPKLLFSTSLSVDLMKEADMDKYMEFRPISAIFHYDNQLKKFLLTPSSKGQIFVHKDLSLVEKRNLFKTLQSFINIFHLKNDVKVDVNSTNEFDKTIEVDKIFLENYEKFKDQNCLKFLEALGIKDKIRDILLYTLSNVEYNLENSSNIEISTEELFTRMFKFVKSLGVHSSLPFLYTIYGTGDIPQAYARISAVYGSTYIINESLKISKIKKNEDKFQVFCDIAGENKFFTCGRIVCGIEYQETIFDVFDEKFKETYYQKSNKISNLLRMVFIVKGDFFFINESNEEEEEGEYKKKLPLIYVIPPCNQILKNLHPVTCIIFGQNSYSSPKGKFLLCLKTIIDDEKQFNYEEFSKRVQDFVLTEIKKEKENEWEFIFSGGYFQRKFESNSKMDLETGICLLKNNDFEIDLDHHFKEFTETIAVLLPELKIKENSGYFINEVNQENEEDGNESEINKLLNKLDKIVLNTTENTNNPPENPKPEEKIPDKNEN